MDTTLMDRLRPIGFTPAIAQSMAAIGGPGAPMRLIEVHRETVRVTDGAHEHLARPLPGLLRALLETGDALAVGDWLVGATRRAQNAVGPPANGPIHASRATQFIGRTPTARDQRR